MTERKRSAGASILGGVLAGLMVGGILLVGMVAIIALVKVAVWLWML